MRPLHDGLRESAARLPRAPAVIEPGRATVTYAELEALAAGVHSCLHEAGVRPGDRVALRLPKSIDAIGAIAGILRAGAVYVPLDLSVPIERAALMIADAGAAVTLTTASELALIDAALRSIGAQTRLVPLEMNSGGSGLLSWIANSSRASTTPDPVHTAPGAPAYLMYTSGSTGRPKGVLLSHLAGDSFVEWASAQFQTSSADRFTSHAPLHFAMSVFDVFMAQRNSAALILLDDSVAANPLRLASIIEEERPTIWYSTPSILKALSEYGRLDEYDCDSLRIVLFAGEPFPVSRLQHLMGLWPAPRYFNLFGATETNVRFWYEVPNDGSLNEMSRLPIGQPCAHFRTRVVSYGRVESAEDIGELLLSGPGILSSYWNLPDLTAAAIDVDDDGVRWFRTGDLVSERPDGSLEFRGRRDRMVKRHGYRIELGDIEAGLASHEAIAGVAVVAVEQPAGKTVIHAFCRPNGSSLPSTVSLKKYCIDRLPPYMVPDRFHMLADMPSTSTGKIDYQTLRVMATREAADVKMQ